MSALLQVLGPLLDGQQGGQSGTVLWTTESSSPFLTDADNEWSADLSEEE